MSKGFRVGIIASGVVIVNVMHEVEIPFLVAVQQEQASHELLLGIGSGPAEFSSSWVIFINYKLSQMLLDALLLFANTSTQSVSSCNPVLEGLIVLQL